MAQEVRHNQDDSRYEILVDGTVAGFCEYCEDEGAGRRDFNHTVVHDGFQGQGLSKPLIKAALDDTREAGLGVVPTCSAVEGFIKKNPEYQDLVA